MKTINTQYILALKPCKDRLSNYLQHYSKFEGTLKEFLLLPNITIHDKVWVISRNYAFVNKEQLNQFRTECYARAVMCPGNCSVSWADYWKKEREAQLEILKNVLNV
jgi:hypothetical protein